MAMTGMLRKVMTRLQALTATLVGVEPGDVVVDPTTGVPALVGLDALGLPRVYPSAPPVTIASGAFPVGGGASTDPEMTFDFVLVYSGHGALIAPAAGVLVAVAFDVGALNSLVSYTSILGTVESPAPRGLETGVFLLRTNAAGHVSGTLTLNTGAARTITGVASLTVVSPQGSTGTGVVPASWSA